MEAIENGAARIEGVWGPGPVPSERLTIKCGSPEQFVRLAMRAYPMLGKEDKIAMEVEFAEFIRQSWQLEVAVRRLLQTTALNLQEQEDEDAKAIDFASEVVECLGDSAAHLALARAKGVR